MKGITSVSKGQVYLFIVLICSIGCLDRAPAPVCPVPIEVSRTEAATAQFDGVDLLVVVDNSASMEKEQQILSTGFFTLINSLAKPLESSDWAYPPVENLRVAIVSSDMGLQYGEARENSEDPGVDTCEDLKGDDGRFLSVPLSATTPIISGTIGCDPDNSQCPTGYECREGACYSQSGEDLLLCNFNDSGPFVEHEKSSLNSNFTERLACLALQGTKGCGIEQQLEASVRALEINEQKGFMKDSHLLAVLVVSDEEDCSIKDPGLFELDDWTKNVNTACNLNEDKLFDPTRYKKALVKAKGKGESAVIFAAIVGVPIADNCQGTGDAVSESGCLDLEAMQLEPFTYKEGEPDEFVHFREACSRYDKDGNELTLARPGRRFVKVAEDFGKNGYVYSICNKDWSPAMQTIAEIIARQIEPTCYPKQLEWELLSKEEKSTYPNCEGCGWAKCNVVMELQVSANEDPYSACPPALYEGLSAAQAKKYRDMITVEQVEEAGKITGHNVTCPIPKLPTALDCNTARGQVDALYDSQTGWFYCENADGTTGEDACNDGVDNNDNGLMDCEDPTCATCKSCGGESSTCYEGCRYGVSLNQNAKDASARSTIAVQCLQRPKMEDANCREDSPIVCNDDKDNDGNGVWDCDDTLSDPGAKNPHLAEPHCCPMTVENGKCVPIMPEIKAHCGRSPKLSSKGADFWTNPANAKQVGACIAQKEALNCEW